MQKERVFKPYFSFSISRVLLMCSASRDAELAEISYNQKDP